MANCRAPVARGALPHTVGYIPYEREGGFTNGAVGQSQRRTAGPWIRRVPSAKFPQQLAKEFHVIPFRIEDRGVNRTAVGAPNPVVSAPF